MVLFSKSNPYNIKEELKIKINGTILDIVLKYKYLWLWIDETLKFEDHINYISGIV